MKSHPNTPTIAAKTSNPLCTHSCFPVAQFHDATNLACATFNPSCEVNRGFHFHPGHESGRIETYGQE